MRRFLVGVFALACTTAASGQQAPTIVGFDFTKATFADPHFLDSSTEDIRTKLVPAWNREASLELQRQLWDEGVRSYVDPSSTEHENLSVSQSQLFGLPTDREFLDAELRAKNVRRYVGGSGLAILVMVESLNKEADASFLEWNLFDRSDGRIVRYGFSKGTTGGGGVHDFYLKGIKKAIRSAAGEIATAIRQQRSTDASKPNEGTLWKDRLVVSFYASKHEADVNPIAWAKLNAAQKLSVAERLAEACTPSGSTDPRWIRICTPHGGLIVQLGSAFDTHENGRWQTSTRDPR